MMYTIAKRLPTQYRLRYYWTSCGGSFILTQLLSHDRSFCCVPEDLAQTLPLQVVDNAVQLVKKEPSSYNLVVECLEISTQLQQVSCMTKCVRHVL